MEQVILARSGQRPLKFQGEEIASGATSLNNASPDYSGSAGRAQEVLVYKTAKGKYIVAIHHTTQWQGEHDSDEAQVCDSKGAAIDYLKDDVPGWLLTNLIAALGKEDIAEEIE